MFLTTSITLVWLLLTSGGATANDLIYQRALTKTAITQALPSDLKIELARTSCYGGCAAYNLTIYGDGRVIYKGGDNVKTRGEIQARISQDKVKELLAAFEKINYNKLADNYDHGSPECKNWGTDMPFAITSLTENRKEKTIRHYLGCNGTQVAQLAWLENKIDETVNSKQWIE